MSLKDKQHIMYDKDKEIGNLVVYDVDDVDLAVEELKEKVMKVCVEEEFPLGRLPYQRVHMLIDEVFG